jgi:hypothetical protein
MEKVTYTPTEFAAVFGKERTWAYRQLYNGKVQAITELGRTLIPKSEVDRLLKEAGRYMGAKAKTRKDAPPVAPTEAADSSRRWSDAVKRRKTRGSRLQENAHFVGDRKPSSPKPPHHDAPASEKRSVYQRLTRYKSSQKSDEGRGG